LTLYFYNVNKAHEKLWQEYVAIDYGRAVPKKNYKGFKSFVADVSKAKVNGTISSGLTLKFEKEEHLTWFVLKWG